MQMKLTSYSAEGKFEGFLELGKDFGYYGDFIRVYKNGFVNGYDRDEKDPLNRFNGLFNGRTYGNGRFVLIERDNYQFFKSEYHGDRLAYENADIFISFEGALSKRFDHKGGLFWRADFPYLNPSECIGNIFENPELFSKL